MASHVSYTVRLSLMFRETARRIGTAVNVRIGDAIPATAMNGFSDERLMEMLRGRTEALAVQPAKWRFPESRRLRPALSNAEATRWGAKMKDEGQSVQF